MTMLTASMAPEIDPGDVTIVTPISISEVTEGMVITYHKPIDDHSLVTHRVVSVEKTNGTVTVQTKGDANDAIDPWTATLEGDTAYEVRAVIPELGHLIQALRAPVVTEVLLYGAPTAAPAVAQLADSAAVGTTTIATGTVAPATNLVGKLNCTSPALMSATW